MQTRSGKTDRARVVEWVRPVCACAAPSPLTQEAVVSRMGSRLILDAPDVTARSASRTDSQQHRTSTARTRLARSGDGRRPAGATKHRCSSSDRERLELSCMRGEFHGQPDMAAPALHPLARASTHRTLSTCLRDPGEGKVAAAAPRPALDRCRQCSTRESNRRGCCQRTRAARPDDSLVRYRPDGTWTRCGGSALRRRQVGGADLAGGRKSVYTLQLDIHPTNSLHTAAHALRRAKSSTYDPGCLLGGCMRLAGERLIGLCYLLYYLY